MIQTPSEFVSGISRNFQQGLKAAPAALEVHSDLTQPINSRWRAKIELGGLHRVSSNPDFVKRSGCRVLLLSIHCKHHTLCLKRSLCSFFFEVFPAHVSHFLSKTFFEKGYHLYLLLSFFRICFTSWLVFSERVGVSIHQDCGSKMIIPFLDCDTAGSEQTNQEEVRATGETVL